MTSRYDGLSVTVHCRYSRATRQSVYTNPVCAYERVAHDVKRLRTTLECLDGGSDIFRSPDFRCSNFKPERAGRCLNLAHFQHGGGIIGIGHHRQPAEAGNYLAQEFESFGSKISILHRQAGDVFTRTRQTRDQADTNRVACRRKDDWDH